MGMILWPKAKRSVSWDTARQVAAAAQRHAAQPVAVFVDEDAETIQRWISILYLSVLPEFSPAHARLRLSAQACACAL